MAFDYVAKADDAHERLKFYFDDHCIADVAFKREKPLISLFTTYVAVNLPEVGEVFINASSLKKRTFDLLNKDERLQTLYDRMMAVPAAEKTTELKRLLDGVVAIRSHTRCDLSTATALQKADEDLVLNAIKPLAGEDKVVAANKLVHADPTLLNDKEFIKKAIKDNPHVINYPFPSRTDRFLAECLNEFPETASVLKKEDLDALVEKINKFETMEKVVLRDYHLIKKANPHSRNNPRLQTLVALLDGNEFYQVLRGGKRGPTDVPLSFVACGVSSRHTSPGVFHYPLFSSTPDRFEAPLKSVPRSTFEKIKNRFQSLSGLLGLPITDRASLAPFIIAAQNRWSDKEALKAACRENGLAYLFASEEGKVDVEIIEIAVKKNPEVLDLLPYTFKRNLELIRTLSNAIITTNPLNLEFIPSEFLSKELVLKAVRANRDAFEFAREFQSDRDVLTAAGIETAPRPRAARGGGGGGAAGASAPKAATGGGAVEKSSSHPLEDSILRENGSTISFDAMIMASRGDKDERHRAYRLATNCRPDEDIARHFRSVVSRQYHPDKLVGEREEIRLAKQEIFKVLSVLASD